MNKQPKDITAKKSYLDWCKSCLKQAMNVKPVVNPQSITFWKAKIEQVENMSQFNAIDDVLGNLHNNKI
jgi:hypothetical protein